ncbi:MAG: helix-hairpin-helix domain-containing protein [Anaerovoracaceae bacterium]
MHTIINWIRENKKLANLFKDNKDMFIKVAAAALVVVVAFVFILKGGSGEIAEIQDSSSETTAITEERVDKKVIIDIGGEVNEPKVTELPEGSRVEDAIEAAGGITDEADMTNINRAAFVSDGEKILIPSKNDAVSGSDGTYTGAQPGGYADDRIDINTADSAELQKLNGVGPATAEKIISYRESNGRFKSVEEIKNVSGIGDKTYEKIKEHIRV